MGEPVDGLSAGACGALAGLGDGLAGSLLHGSTQLGEAGAGDVRGSCEGRRGGGERGRTAGGRRRVSMLRPTLCEVTTEIEIG